MADVNFKLIQNESYESICSYLDCVVSLTKELGIPSFINLDGKRYFVTAVKNMDSVLYAMSFEDKGKLRTYGITKFNDSLVCSLTDGISIYRDYTSRDKPFVQKENIVNDNKEILFLDKSHDGKDELVYQQSNYDTGVDCEIVYDIENHISNLQSYIHFIDGKYPKCFRLIEDKKIFKIINKRQSEKFVYYDGAYLMPALKFLCFEFANAKETISLQDVRNHLNENGFNSCIPREMGTIFVNENQTENTLKKLIKIYDENCMKMGIK